MNLAYPCGNPLCAQELCSAFEHFTLRINHTCRGGPTLERSDLKSAGANPISADMAENPQRFNILKHKIRFLFWMCCPGYSEIRDNRQKGEGEKMPGWLYS